MQCRPTFHTVSGGSQCDPRSRCRPRQLHQGVRVPGEPKNRSELKNRRTISDHTRGPPYILHVFCLVDHGKVGIYQIKTAFSVYTAWCVLRQRQDNRPCFYIATDARTAVPLMRSPALVDAAKGAQPVAAHHCLVQLHNVRHHPQRYTVFVRQTTPVK